MKKISFEVEESGFYGVYWENKNKSNSALIAMPVSYTHLVVNVATITDG